MTQWGRQGASPDADLAPHQVVIVPDRPERGRAAPEGDWGRRNWQPGWPGAGISAATAWTRDERNNEDGLRGQRCQ